MNCSEARERMAERLTGGHGPAALAGHLAECPACGEEWRQVSETWEKLSRLPEETPGPAVRARFYQMLEVYEQGLRDAPAVKRETRSGAWWWPRQPAMQFAAAMSLLAVGLLVGILAPWHRGGKQEVATLRSEVQNMRQLVALSLLQQQSASDRLRGVTYSYRVQQPDTEVLSALLRTLNTDGNVNVRLAAVDALTEFQESPVARRGIVQSLPKQDSPLVQVALLEVIRQMHDAGSADAITQVARDPRTNETVRQRAQQIAVELSQ